MAVTPLPDRYVIPTSDSPLTDEERRERAESVYSETGVNLLRDCPGVFDVNIIGAIQFPHPSLTQAYESGCAEPWMSQLVASLLIASNQRTVLETGGFTGQTTAWLALALEHSGGGRLTACDIDSARASAIQARLDGLPLPRTEWQVVNDDVLHYLTTIPDESLGFAWVDDCHEMDHVDKEVRLLLPKMKTGGLITFHDVFGSCDLRQVVTRYGGYSLDLPRLGPAGGLGIIQLRD